jgi:hypothetical protein
MEHRATLAAFCERVNKQRERLEEVYALHAETLEALAEDEKEMKRLQASAAKHEAFLAQCEEAAAKITSDDPILVTLTAPTPTPTPTPAPAPAPAQILPRDADDEEEEDDDDEEEDEPLARPCDLMYDQRGTPGLSTHNHQPQKCINCKQWRPITSFPISDKGHRYIAKCNDCPGRASRPDPGLYPCCLCKADLPLTAYRPWGTRNGTQRYKTSDPCMTCKPVKTRAKK